MDKQQTFEYNRYADIKRLLFIEQELKEKVKPGGRVLDFGCGNGIISRHLGKKGYRVTGIDVDAKAIDVAKGLNKSELVDFQVGSPQGLQFPSDTFDAIICSEVIEHLTQPESLLLTLNKVLKQDGVLVVTVPNGFGPREALITKPVQYLNSSNGVLSKALNGFKRALGYDGRTVQSASDDLQHIQFFSVTALRDLARNSRFQIVRYAKSNFIDDVFPFSLVARRSQRLQRLDSQVADALPLRCTGGFLTVWKKTA